MSYAQSVINRVNAYVAQLPEVVAQPDQVTVMETDELFTFVEQKKTEFTS